MALHISPDGYAQALCAAPVNVSSMGKCALHMLVWWYAVLSPAAVPIYIYLLTP